MTVVYEYGCRAPTEGAELVREQMSLAHRYYNKLIEIETERRAATEAAFMSIAAYSEAVDRLAAVEDRLETVRARIAEIKATARRDVDTPDFDLSAREWRAARKVAAADLRAARAGAKKELVDRLAVVNEAAAQAKRDARGASEVYWGTYLVVEQAAQAACSGPTLHFARWDGSGHLAVQIQKGIATEDLMGSDMRVRLDPLDPDAYTHPSRGERTRRQRTFLRLRVGSEGRAPIWAVLPVILHRPMPRGRVKWVHLLRRRVEAKEVWRVQIVVDTDERVEDCGQGVVGIDLGWRVTPEGLRVATAAGDGIERLVLRDDVGGALRHSDGLRGTRDDNLTAILGSLRGWLHARMSTLPPWLAEATTYLHQWRSQARLAALALRWRTERFAGDEDGFAQIEAWRKQDKHLWTWETHERDRALGRRREQYRVWAAELARRYEIVVLEAFDLRAVAEQKPQEEDKDDNAGARHNRQLAAVSTLRSAIVNAFRRRGGIVIMAPSVNTTRQCHGCRQICEWDQEQLLRHRCEHCGAEWDQDDNAARNLRDYASADVVGPAREALAAPTVRVSRFRKRSAASGAAAGASDAAPLEKMEATADDDREIS